MKKILYLIFCVAALAACTNLDEEIYSSIAKDDFFTSEDQLKVGDKVTVLIPSNMAYGEGTRGIPPYSPLEFDIELLEIVNE